MGRPADREGNRVEGRSAAPRAHGPGLLSGAPLWGRGASRGRGVRRKGHWAIRPWRVSSAVIGARRLGRLSHMS
jgi:hypothetical protein